MVFIIKYTKTTMHGYIFLSNANNPYYFSKLFDFGCQFLFSLVWEAKDRIMAP